LRDELLNRGLFLSVPEARYVLDEWREDYDERRPRGSLKWRTPAAFAASLAGPPVGATPLPAAQPADQHQPILS
jgi:transposase InsO family protein